MRIATAALLALSACHAAPELNGASLLCGDDASCPDGLRCYQGGCIRNAPPSIEPAGVIFTTVGQPVTLRILVDDLEDDPVTVTWEQTAGSALIASPATGVSLTVTPPSEETYAFLLTPRDPYAAGATVPISLVAMIQPPPPGAVYVSDAGLDYDGCGGIDDPCATIARGLSRRPSPQAPLLLAVAQLGGAYYECLRLNGSDTILGSFDTEWRFDPLLRERTRVECALSDSPGVTLPTDVADVGHVLRGSASLIDLTLAVDATRASAGEGESLVTVLFDEPLGTATLTDVLVEAPSCQAPCASTAIWGQAASPRLEGVDVRGRADTLEFPAGFLGMVFVQGAPVVLGDTESGSILLNVASSDLATGIFARDSALRVEGMQILGGLSSVLVGIQVSGGAPVVRENNVDMRAFGAALVFGVAASPCFLLADDCPFPAPPAATVELNTVTLRGGTGTFGQTPCFGAGVWMATNYEGYAPSPLAGRVYYNTIYIEGGFALSVGVATQGGVAETALNEIDIGPSNVDDANCEDVNRQLLLPSAESHGGAVGVAVIRPNGDQVNGNLITMQANAKPTLGLWVRDSEGAAVVNNTVDVGRAAVLLSSSEATGAVLRNGTWTGATPSTFDANRLYVHDGMFSGTGLRLVQVTPWLVTNNAIYGGDTPYSTGVEILTDGKQSDWPRLLHNTIHAGGAATGPGVPETVVSRALAVGIARQDSGAGATEIAISAVPAGVLVNNLFDVGDGTGRRFVIDNPTGVGIDTFLGNALHQQGTRSPLVPAAGLLAARSTGVGYAYVVEPAAGSLVSAVVSSSAPQWSQEHWQGLGGAPTAAWAGGVDFWGVTGAVVVGFPGSVALSERTAAAFLPFRRFEATAPYGDPPQATVLTPTLIGRGKVDENALPDVVFITTQTGVTALWTMLASGSSGLTGALSPPIWIMDLVEPTHMTVSGADADLVDFGRVDRVYIVEQPPAPGVPELVTVPELTGVAGLSFPVLPISALAAGFVRDGLGNSPALAVISGGAVHAWRTSFPNTEVAILETPCNGATPTSLAIGVFAGGVYNRLLVGCSNGHIDAMGLGFIGFSYGLKYDMQSNSAAQAGPVSFAAAFNDFVIVGLEGSELIALYGADPGARSLTLLSSYAPAANVGDWNATTTLYTDASSLLVPGLTPGVCSLEVRRTGVTDPPDLHLEPNVADDCRDSGESFTQIANQTVITDVGAASVDMDGAARDAATPEVGADEE